jgi:hypothetical protein
MTTTPEVAAPTVEPVGALAMTAEKGMSVRRWRCAAATAMAIKALVAFEAALEGVPVTEPAGALAMAAEKGRSVKWWGRAATTSVEKPAVVPVAELGGTLAIVVETGRPTEARNGGACRGALDGVGCYDGARGTLTEGGLDGGNGHGQGGRSDDTGRA